MEWLKDWNPSSEALVVGLIVCLALLLLTVPPWVMAVVMWRRNRLLGELLVKGERRHTNELLEQSRRFGQQLYRQQEQNSLSMSHTVRQLTDSWSRAVSGMPED